MRHWLTAVLLLVAVAAGQWPDRGGYRALDSDTAVGPVFQWVDISSTGTRVPIGDDDNAGPFALGFTLDFYGRARDSVRICSNGWLSFTSSSHQFHHFPVPDSREPNSLLAALWADLDPAQAGEVRYRADAAHGRFIVSWLGVPVHGTAEALTFQVILDSSGDVLYQYRNAGFDSCTAGIENDSGTIGQEYWRDCGPAQNRLHDSLAVRFFRVDRDAAAAGLLRPGAEELAGDSVRPLVRAWNPGRLAASFPVTLRIGPGYEQRIDLAGLGPLADTLLEFPVWVPGTDTYAVTLFAALPGDEFTANDTLTRRVTGSYTGELRYDDGEPDTWFLRNGAPNADWAAAVRFTSPYTTFRLVRGRVQTEDTQPFARVLVCADSAGVPRLGAPYAAAESVAAREPGQWLELPADTLVSGGTDLWLVAFWPRGADGPRIGEDRDPPLDGRVKYGSPTVRWLPYTAGDLLMRLDIDGRAAVEESRAPDARRLTPRATIFRGVLTLPVSSLASPLSEQRVNRNSSLVDATGRLVLALKPGPNDVSALAPGVYFVRIAYGIGREASSVTRVVIAR